MLIRIIIVVVVVVAAASVIFVINTNNDHFQFVIHVVYRQDIHKCVRKKCSCGIYSYNKEEAKKEKCM